MKLSYILTISFCLLVSNWTLGQVEVDSASDSTKIYYEMELVATGEINSEKDTVFNVYLVLDSTDLGRFELLSMESSSQTNELSTVPNDENAKARIKKDKNKVRVDILEWSDPQNLKVTGRLPDGTMIKLKRRKSKEQVTHEVKRIRPKTRQPKRYEGSEIGIGEEAINESEAEEKSTKQN